MQVLRRLLDHLPRLLRGRLTELDDHADHETREDLRRRQHEVQARLRSLELDAEIKGRQRSGSDR